MPGQIEVLDDGRLRVRWVHPSDTTPKGKRKQYGCSDFVDRDDAEDFRIWMRQNGDRFRPTDPEIRQRVWIHGGEPVRDDHGVTFERFALADIAARPRASERTKEEYRKDVYKLFADWLRLPVAAITQEMIRAKIDWFYDTYAPKTAAGYALFLGRFFRMAHERGVTDHNLLRKHGMKGDEVVFKNPMTLPRGRMVNGKLEKKDRDSVFVPVDELRKLHDAAIKIDERATPFRPRQGGESRRYPQTQMIMRTFVGTALRIAELLALRVGDLDVFSDLENSYLRLAHAVSLGRDGKLALGNLKGRQGGEEPEAIPLAPSFAFELREYVTMLGLNPTRDRDLFVFAAPRSWGRKPWWPEGWRSDRWHPMLHVAYDEFDLPRRIKPTPHSLRHGYASTMLNNGATAYDVSVILRHRNVKTTTSIYGHVDRQLYDRMRVLAAQHLPLPPLSG